MLPAHCCQYALCGCNHECKHLLIAFVNCKGHSLNNVRNDTEHLYYPQNLRPCRRNVSLSNGPLILPVFFFLICTKEDETGRANVPGQWFLLFRAWLRIKHCNRPHRDHQICAFWANSKKIQSVRLIKWLQNWKAAPHLLFKSKIGHIHCTAALCFVLLRKTDPAICNLNQKNQNSCSDQANGGTRDSECSLFLY